jgi:hypothetical protein
LLLVVAVVAVVVRVLVTPAVLAGVRQVAKTVILLMMEKLPMAAEVVVNQQQELTQVVTVR